MEDESEERTRVLMELNNAIGTTGFQKANELVEAGELMYASQWSYGQRCGLGGVETDFLVSTLREQGIDHGIYGAKITGRGCGAMVAVLMQATEQAQAATDSAVRATATKFGLEPLILRGSSPGALLGGVQTV